MDMSKEYGEVDPIIEKSQFLQSLCEQIIAGHRFAKGQQSIIDRCTENVYRFYKQGDYRGEPPTLQDFRSELLRQRSRKLILWHWSLNFSREDLSILLQNRRTWIRKTDSYATTSWSLESSCGRSVCW